MSRDTAGTDDGPGVRSEPGSNADPDGDGRTAPVRWVAVAVVFAVLASSAFLRSTSVVDPRFVLVAFGLFFPIALGLAWRRSRAGSRRAAADRPSTDDAGGGDGGDGSVWNAIPSWQYEGRHVESGGLTRSEQERALQDIQEQADELSDDPAREG